VYPGAAPGHAEAGMSSSNDATDLSLVCTLPPAGQDGRRVTLRSLMTHATQVTEEPDGVQVDFHGSDDVATMLLQFVLAERQCCARFTYDLQFAPDHSTVAFRVTGAGRDVAPLKALYLDRG
jgi:hypothetical protein